MTVCETISSGHIRLGEASRLNWLEIDDNSEDLSELKEDRREVIVGYRFRKILIDTNHLCDAT